jgi:hypothetical protein
MRVRPLYQPDDDEEGFFFDDDGEEISLAALRALPECDLRQMVLDGGYGPEHQGIALAALDDGSFVPVEVWSDELPPMEVVIY